MSDTIPTFKPLDIVSVMQTSEAYDLDVAGLTGVVKDVDPGGQGVIFILLDSGAGLVWNASSTNHVSVEAQAKPWYPRLVPLVRMAEGESL